MSAVMYLNDDFEGGGTAFIDGNENQTLVKFYSSQAIGPLRRQNQSLKVQSTPVVTWYRIWDRTVN